MQRHILALLKDSKQREIASPSITWFIILPQWFCYKQLRWVVRLILWKVTSPSPEPVRPSLRQRALNWKCLGRYVIRTYRKTYSKTLWYSILKLKYSPKHRQEKNKYALLNNSHRSHMNRTFYKIFFRSIDQSFSSTGHMPVNYFYAPVTQHVEVTKSLSIQM